uniref:Uncharacterized protein n=1 Tax=Arundo donax TaxID=35708 RepID=A0A0A8YVB0_ARUDO
MVQLVWRSSNRTIYFLISFSTSHLPSAQGALPASSTSRAGSRRQSSRRPGIPSGHNPTVVIKSYRD